MPATIEIEAKFRLLQPARLRARIRRLGYRVAKSRRLETNWIFDDVQQHLRRSGRLLRLRRSGREWMLTAKGNAGRSGGGLKRRREEQTEVARGEACRALLDVLGYRETLCYVRHRTTFAKPGGAGELAWDETPFGVYLEIEGAAPWVRSTAAALGLRLDEAETRSYPELYRSLGAGLVNGNRS